MKEIARKALLYDFYGELLTEHQKKVYEDAVMNDFSLSELAEEYGISRQGIHDLLKRCDTILEEYESKLGLIKRFSDVRIVADEMTVILKDLPDATTKAKRTEIAGALNNKITKIREI